MATSANRFKALLHDLKGKIAFRDMTAILKAKELGTAAGWDKLEERLNDASADLADKAEVVLKALQEGITIAGTKDVFVYDLTEEEADFFSQSVAAIAPTPGNFSDSYPMAISETALKALSTDHELVKNITRDNGDVSLVFCAKRSQEERDLFNFNQVNAAVQTAFAGYDEFIAIKRTDYQVFDVLTVRRSLRRIEILIDHPDLLKGADASELRCLMLLGRTATIVSEMMPIYEANTPLNLMPCISNLYHAANEGRISKLSFRAPTSSVNRAMTSTQDLRTEAFHAAGVASVGDITPYDVTVLWDSLAGVAGSAGLRVSMAITGLSADDAHVRQARIIAATSDAAVVAVVNKLVSYST